MLRIKMIDLQGKQIMEKSFLVEKGTNLINFPLDNLSNGIYFVTLNNDSKSITRKLVTPNQ